MQTNSVRWFVHELRGLVMRLEMAVSDDPELIDGEFSVSVLDQARELADLAVDLSDVSDADLRRCDPADGVRATKRILRRMLDESTPLSVTIEDDARDLRKILNSFQPIDAPESGVRPDDEVDSTADKPDCSMKVIVEHYRDGEVRVCVYRETPEVYAMNEPERARTATKRTIESLDDECKIEPGEYIVFNV